MFRSERTTSGGRRARTLLVFGLALCTLLFVVLSSSHFHPDNQNDAACRLCQAAHVGVSTAPAVGALPTPLVERAEVSSFASSVALELFLHSAPSRAPPSA